MSVMLLCWGAGLMLGLLVLVFVVAAGNLPANEGEECDRKSPRP
jgi:hypothetical protein